MIVKSKSLLLKQAVLCSPERIYDLRQNCLFSFGNKLQVNLPLAQKARDFVSITCDVNLYGHLSKLHIYQSKIKRKISVVGTGLCREEQ